MDTITEKKPVMETTSRAASTSTLKASPATKASHGQIAGVEENVDLLMYNSGETILAEGDTSQHACQLVSGSAKVIREGEMVATIHSGEYFGTIAALTNNRRSAAVVASELSVVRIISKHKFRLLLQTHPEILDKLY